MHSATCAECGDRCEVPFRPTGERPVLCSNCFRGNKPTPRNDGGRMSFPEKASNSEDLNSLKKEVTELSKKLDKVLLLLQRTNPVKEVTVMKNSKGKDEVVEELETPKSKKKTVAKKVTTKASDKKTPVEKKKVTKKAPTKKAAAKKKVTKKASAKKNATKKK